MNNRIITQPQIDELRKKTNSRVEKENSGCLTGERNVELTSITPFKENERWYLRLVYKYENNMGKHTVVIPKAGLPFAQGIIPNIDICRSLNMRPHINCSDTMTLYDSACDLAIELGATEQSCYFDIITEYNTREMTLDEIENELGYKVKIINKEESNA